jgi:hypothetical protein
MVGRRPYGTAPGPGGRWEEFGCSTKRNAGSCTSSNRPSPGRIPTDQDPDRRWGCTPRHREQAGPRRGADGCIVCSVGAVRARDRGQIGCRPTTGPGSSPTTPQVATMTPWSRTIKWSRQHTTGEACGRSPSVVPPVHSMPGQRRRRGIAERAASRSPLRRFTGYDLIAVTSRRPAGCTMSSSPAYHCMRRQRRFLQGELTGPHPAVVVPVSAFVAAATYRAGRHCRRGAVALPDRQRC